MINKDKKTKEKTMLALKNLKTYLFIFFFLLGTNFLFAIDSHAQNAKVSVGTSKKTVGDVLSAIEEVTDYVFFYRDGDVDLSRKVDITTKDESIDAVLTELFNNSNNLYTILGRQVYIKQNTTSIVTTQKTMPINGIVLDASGEPLIGVNVTIKGTTEGTVSNLDGEFTIECNSQDILIFSYIGYLKKEVKVLDKREITVVLEEDDQLLDEVIVIGYGTTTRKGAIGAVDQVKMKSLEQQPVASVTQALQGASPSLTIQQRSMDPNKPNASINIRGISTMNNNSPLIVIDGLITDDAALNKLNPSDIENISILKDAGTAAIYGSRSANGVILVTTKIGQKNQKPTVRMNAQAGIQDPHILVKPVSGYQNATLMNLGLTNSNKDAKYTPSQIQDLYVHRDDEYWNYDKIIKNALQQTYNVSVSGGSANTTYMFSSGYYNQESNLIGPSYGIQRYNLRSNLRSEIGRTVVTSLLSYSRNDDKSTIDGNAISNAVRIPPYYWTNMQASNGKYLINELLTDQNPMAGLEKGGYQKGNTDYINLNLGLELNIYDGLKFRGIVGADIYAYHRFIRRKQIPLYYNAENSKPDMYMNATRDTEDYNETKRLLNYQTMLDYQKVFNNVHNISTLLGASNESYSFKNNEIKNKYTDPLLGTPSGKPEDVSGSTSLNGLTKTSLTSLFGRLSYNFDEKYYAEFSFRQDGSSILAKQNRWQFFPSSSFGWRISQESFMESYQKNIGDFKLRGSYGVLGNQSISPYSVYTYYNSFSNSYVFNNNAVGGAGFSYGNENLNWEKSYTINIGIDFSFLKGSLNGTFDYFHKKTDDILQKPIIPSVFGTSMPWQNIGQMKSSGWEITLNYNLIRGKFSHNFNLNIGDSQNKVTRLVGGDEIQQVNEYAFLKRVGLPLNSYFGYKTDGYFKTMEEIYASSLPVGMSPSDLRPGDVKYVDRNNDGIIDLKDRFILGNGFPRYIFGFNYALSYKGFDAGILLQGVGKRDMMIRGELIEPFHENYSYVMYTHQLDFWTDTNISSRWPRLSAIGSTSNKNNYGMGSNLNLLDGKYLRIKNIQAGYTIPKNIISRLGIGKTRIYINAQNLFTFSKNSWIDPESSEFNGNMSGNANSGRNYPSLRYYGLGIDLEF